MDKWSILYMGAIFSCDSAILEALWQIVYRPSCREVWSKLPDHCSLETIVEDLKQISKTLSPSHWQFSLNDRGYPSGCFLTCVWIFQDRANNVSQSGSICIYINAFTEEFSIKELYFPKYPQIDRSQMKQMSLKINPETRKCIGYILDDPYEYVELFIESSTLKEQILFVNEQLHLKSQRIQ